MENNNKPPTAKELLRKIMELEERQAHIKQEISKRMTHRPKLDHQIAINGEKVKPLSMKLTETLSLNILESTGQSIFIYDVHHRIIFWNRVAEHVFGYTCAEVIGRTPTEVIVEPESAHLSDNIIERTVKGESWYGVFPIKKKSGESFLAICANTPYRDANNRLIGAISISSDTRPYQVVKVGLTVTQPMRTASTRFGFDPQQPSMCSFASKISNLALKVKSKMMIEEKCTDNEDHLDKTFDNEENTPIRGHIAPSPFGVFFSLNTDQSLSRDLVIDTGNRSENKPWIRNVLSSKADAWMNKKIEASASWPSTFRISRTTSSMSSTSCLSSTKCNNANLKVNNEKDNLDYEIMWEDLITKQQIGQGSCGTVYHGLWYGSDVAIKVFAHHELSYDVLVSFKQEVSLMKRLRHPNILLFMGAVISPQHPCIVTEFLPRGSLFRILQRNTTNLDWKRRLRMAIDIARGMNYLHLCQPPIIHRDLKSSNLLVDKNWTVKVGDFGLSRIKHQMSLNTKTAKGTPRIAPEILRNGQADEKSDVYSYGVVLWEIITEKIPWVDLDPVQVIKAVGFLNKRLEIPKDVDPLWDSLIESCWRSEPQSRPAFQEILCMLKELKKKFAVERKK